MQLAKFENLNVDDIKYSIDDEPYNNIVEIAGVHTTSVQDMSDDDTVMIVEPPKHTKYNRSHTLTPFELLVGEYKDSDIKVMNSV